MNFILQLIRNEITLDQCYQMKRSKEYWDWKDKDNSFKFIYSDLSDIVNLKTLHEIDPSEWCPIGTIEFVEKYIRTYFGDEVANKTLKPLNVPECFLSNSMNLGRAVNNIVLDETNTAWHILGGLYAKDNEKIKNPKNGVYFTLDDIRRAGLKDVQISSLIPDDHISSEWRVFIHNGEAVDIKNYSGNPFAFPNKESIDSYIYQLNGLLKEGTLDVYVDEIDGDTYVMECHKFFSCGLYGFAQLDKLPLMYWRTYKNLIKDERI